MTKFLTIHLTSKGYIVVSAMYSMDLLTITEDKKITSENIEDLISIEVEERLEQLDEVGYDDWLDESLDMVEIGSLEYNPSHVLKSVDEIAYRCGFTDYQESMRESIEDEVRDELEALIDDDD